MTSPKLFPEAPLPVWRGRFLVFAGILLVALNMRLAVAGLSPIIPLIQQDFPLSIFAISLLGFIAPLCFAIGGIVTPRIARRTGLEYTVIIALALMITGHVLRATASNWGGLSLGTLLALLGMGFGNVLMPPLVKKYFPDRVPLMTSLYMTLVIISSLVPPLVAVPISNSISWRGFLGQWSIFAVLAVIPWVIEISRNRSTAKVAALAATTEVHPDHVAIWRSPTAWAIAIILAVSSMNGYAMFAWMPIILVDISHVSLAQAGALLGIFAAIGVPFAFIMPMIAGRVRRVDYLVHVATACFLIGYAGLIFFPTQAPLLWTIVLGSGPLLFPLAVVMVNLRSRTPRTSMALSGFATTIAYVVALTGPPLMGLLFTATGGWTASLIFLGVFSLSGSVAGVFLARQRIVDDELIRPAI
ncbi:MAG: MFS transporter [Actinomycetales bacterium]|nr:MFS transporter [Actinomycetales bacterium]